MRLRVYKISMSQVRVLIVLNYIIVVTIKKFVKLIFLISNIISQFYHCFFSIFLGFLFFSFFLIRCKWMYVHACAWRYEACFNKHENLKLFVKCRFIWDEQEGIAAINRTIFWSNKQELDRVVHTLPSRNLERCN